MPDWIGLSADVIWWLLVTSAALFGLGILAVPFLVARIPSDYFLHAHRSFGRLDGGTPWLRWVWIAVKNLLGLACVFFGILMLVLPGQGVLTILLGVVLLDFPGKYRLQGWVIRRKGVLSSINWIRRKAGASPLQLRDEAGDSGSDNEC